MTATQHATPTTTEEPTHVQRRAARATDDDNQPTLAAFASTPTPNRRA